MINGDVFTEIYYAIYVSNFNPYSYSMRLELVFAPFAEEMEAHRDEATCSSSHSLGGTEARFECRQFGSLVLVYTTTVPSASQIAFTSLK